MSATVTLNTTQMSREQRDSINNLLKMCRFAIAGVLLFCALLDGCVTTVLGYQYLSNHPGMRQDEAAMHKFAICFVLSLWIVILIQGPLIFYGVPAVILTFARCPSTAKRWVVKALRDGGDIEMGSGF